MSIEARTADESSAAAVRVLVVDDDDVGARELSDSLTAAGYQVALVPDSAGALARLAQGAPELAIVGLDLADGASLAVIRALKRQSGHAIHVVVLTLSRDERRHAEAFEAGSDDVVVKPAVMSDLLRRVAAAMRSRKAFVEIRVAKEVADRRMAYGAEAGALLAHDLNNGLAVALLNVQFLRDTLTLDADETDAIEATIRSLRRMSSLVTNFVDIARFEDAEVTPMVAPAQVHAMLTAVLDVSAASLARDVTIEVSCEPDLAGRFDLALIERVLHNLVGNAARYCNPGGALSLTARRWDSAGGVEISVTNSGPQIPEAIRPHLFEKFVRGSGGKRGMGLYFCRLVAESHGGSVEHEATPIGPRFIVRLPGRG